MLKNKRKRVFKDVKMKIHVIVEKIKIQMVILIGIVGKKNAGKDTMADLLVKRHGFIKHAFATPLKEACKTLFLLNDDQLNDHVLKEKIDQRWGMSPRQIFQKVGTDIIRSHFGNDFWIRHMDQWMLDRNNENIVVSDVRFVNEADWIRSKGGIIVRINTVNGISDDDHISERESEEIVADAEIVNNKTSLNDFYRDIMATEIISEMIYETIL